MAGLSITGQMKVSTLQEGFLKEFGLTLRVYDGRAFADPTQTLAQVRKKKGSGKDLSVAKNMKVGNLEDKFEEEFGLKVQVAGSDDSYLCKDELTLNAAQQQDEKKLARKERKAARQDEAGDSDDKIDKVDDTINSKVFEVLNLITATLGHEKITAFSIEEIASVSDEVWEKIDAELPKLDDQSNGKLNHQIFEITKNLEAGDLWRLFILSAKLLDAKCFLDALQFKHHTDAQSSDLASMSSNIIDFINKHGGYDEFDETRSVSLINHIYDQIIVLLESAMDDADEERLQNILSFVFDVRNSDDILGCSEDLAIYARGGREGDMDFNYVEEIVENAIFIVCQTYQLSEENLRDDDGGLSASHAVSELAAQL